MKNFKSILQSYPKLMVNYVSLGTYFVGKTLNSAQRFMEHLLIIQSIDPNSQPGEKYRQALAMAVDKIYQKDFDDDFDFSWIKKCFNKTKEQLSNLQLSRGQYWNLTNISMLESPIIECEKKELKITEPPLKEGFIKFGDLTTKVQRKIPKKKSDNKKPIKIKKVSTDYSKKEITNVEVKESAIIPKKAGVFRRVG